MRTMLYGILLTGCLSFCALSCSENSPTASSHCGGQKISEDQPFAEHFASIAVEHLTNSPFTTTNQTNRAALLGMSIKLETELHHRLPKARVIPGPLTIDSFAKLAEISQFFDGPDHSEVLLDLVNSHATADIVAITELHEHGTDQVRLVITVIERKKRKILHEIERTGNVTDVLYLLTGDAAAIAEAIKNCFMGLALTPARSVLDYDDPEDRSRTLEVAVRNLKNEPVSGGTVAFINSTGEVYGGTLSRTNATLVGGKADTVFTMTGRAPARIEITLDYPETELFMNAFVDLAPLCSWVVLIEGTKVFDTTANPFPLFGEGSHITLQGEASESGGAILDIADDGTVVGFGWYQETNALSGVLHVVLRNEIGDIVGTRDFPASQSGVSKGGWGIVGTRTGNRLELTGIAFGISGTLGGADTFTTMSFFSNTMLDLEMGATNETSGTMPIFFATNPDGISYRYTLRMTRAGR